MIVARLTTVNGGCTIPGYDKPEDRWFVVESINFGFSKDDDSKKTSSSKTSSSGGPEFVTGQRDETTITINKSIDAASCDLMYQAMNDRFMAKGKQDSAPIKADIHFIETLAGDVVAGANKQGKSAASGVIAYLRIAMQTVKVKSWSISASSDGKPSEEVVLWCEQLAMRFQRTSDGHIYKDAGMQGWDQSLGLQGERKWLPDGKATGSQSRDYDEYFMEKYYPKW